MTRSEWEARGKELFGEDIMKWSFICPSCGHVWSVQDYKNAGAPSGAVGFSCAGRWLPNPKDAFRRDGGPCNYAGGGLLNINPLEVDGVRYFNFYEAREGGGGNDKGK